MSRAERIIIANDNAPLLEAAQKISRSKRRKSRPHTARAVKQLTSSQHKAQLFKPGQMQWQPQSGVLPASKSYQESYHSRINSVAKIEDKSLNLLHIFLMSIFTIAIMASIVSLFYGFRPEISGGVIGTTALIAMMGLSLPKSHKRKREFLSLSAWVTTAIAINIFYPLTTIEFLTFASVLGFVLSMLVRLVSPAVAGTLSLACLVAVILPQTGLI